MPKEELADDMEFRDSTFHPGRTAVAMRRGRTVCWNCHAPVDLQYADVPVGTAWIRICTRARCAAAIEREMRGSRAFGVPGALSAIKHRAQDMMRGLIS